MKTWKDFPIKKDKDNNYYVAFLINSDYVSDYHVVQNDKIGAFDYDEVSKFYEALTGSEMVYNAQDQLVQQKQVYSIPEPTLEDLRTIKYAEVKEDYLKALYAVAWVDQDGNLYGYDTDPGSQLDFSMSHARAKLNGTTRYNVYTDKSNLDTKEFLEHTPEMFDKVLAEVGNYQEDVYKKYYTVKGLVKAAKTQEELAGISFDMEVPVDGQ